MLQKPNKRQSEAIRNIAQNGSAFGQLIEWLESCLSDQRAANDTLPPNEIQIGQGKAQALNMQITILKELTGVGSV